MSPRIRGEAEMFKMQFPWERVCTFFVPSMWGHIISHMDEYKMEPCVTLNFVDSLYNVKDGAKWLIKTNMTKIYSLSMSKEPFAEENADIAADLFIGKYGSQCTLYMMAIYFGSYLSDYKSQYASQFDIQDILKQFREQFLPIWGRTLDNKEVITDDKGHPDRMRGDEALQEWLYREIEKGNDVRTGGLYRLGIVTDKMIAETKARMK